MASVTRLRRPSVVQSRYWRKQAKQTIISGMGGCSWCRVGLGNPYSTRCVTALPHFRIVLSRPASSPHFGEGIDHGTHFNFDAVSINPKPLQQPLPMWIGSGADPAIKRTARMADAWVISPGWTPGHVEEKLHFYRSALQEYGRSGQVTETILRRDIHLGTTLQAARQEAQVLFDKGYRGYGPQEMQESLIVGGPEECIRYLENMQRLGITHILFRPAMRDQKHVLQTIRLLGTDVIPHFAHA